MGRGLFLLSALFLSLLSGREITLEWLSAQPRSYAKDFYIWRYFDRNITPKEADAAFYQIKAVNWKLLRRYAKKTKMPGFAMAVRCQRLGAARLPAQTAECSAIAVTPYKFARMNSKRRFELMRQLDDYPDLLRWMQTMVDERPFFALAKSDPDIFLEVFNRCGRAWRAAHLDHPLPPRLVTKLAQRNGFAQTVKLIVTDPNLPNLRRSLLGIDSTPLGHQATFFLAMNALNLGRPALARLYLSDAYKKAWFRFDRDKVLFWLYRLDPTEKRLRKLAESFDLNIYTLYAHEKLGTKWPRVVSPAFEKEGCGYDIQDPFAWLKALEKIKGKKEAWLIDYSRRFACQETEGHYSFVMERAARWRTHYFPMPYERAFKGLSGDDKAMLLALARQESRFIPSSISPSYALGMMQIMPFLVKALAKERKEPFDLDAMFDPYTNVTYARKHMVFLKRSLHHPLFLAYAYNGGIGFTKRMLTTRGLFEKGAYEPWLSMELVHYDESRRYGKKVLANYVVYKKLLGEPISLESVVETLTEPNRTDRFRSR